MTYREKLQMEHPESINPSCLGGCQMCPHNYGYTSNSREYKACYGFDENGDYNGCDSATCTACWDRVIPGTEEKKLTFKIPTNLDEMIEYFEAHGFGASRSYIGLTDSYTFTINKNNYIRFNTGFKYPEGKSETERGAIMLDYCERLIVDFDNEVLKTKQSCIDDLYKAVDNRDKSIEALKKDNEGANKTIEELEQKIQKLEGACSAKNAEIVRLDKELYKEKARKHFSSAACQKPN